MYFNVLLYMGLIELLSHESLKTMSLIITIKQSLYFVEKSLLLVCSDGVDFVEVRPVCKINTRHIFIDRIVSSYSHSQRGIAMLVTSSTHFALAK